MARWRRDLLILWGCTFAINAGFSLIMPFLPLYIASMGVRGTRAVDLWTGAIFAANFLTAALLSPVWGSLSDRVGRRPMMLRAGFGMAVALGLMGLARAPWQLLVLRLLLGTTAGFIPAAVSYMATAAPPAHRGYALGVLQTGSVAGGVVGPLIGGVLARWLGYGDIFFVTAAASVAAGLAVLLFIREQWPPAGAAPSRRRGSLRSATPGPVKAMLVVMFLVPFSLMMAEPIITVYLKELGTSPSSLTLWSGVAFSATGVASVLVAPFLGRMADRRGPKAILIATLAGSGVVYASQAVATGPWSLAIIRFGLGLFLGGVTPAANALIAAYVPPEDVGAAYGLTTSSTFVGNLLGPLVGGTLAAALGERAVFPATGALQLVAAAWLVARVPAPGAVRAWRRAP